MLPEIPESWMIPCFVKSTTGMECTGCGMQRSVALLLRGQLLNAFYKYPPLFPLIFNIAFLILHLRYKLWQGHLILLILTVITAFSILLNYLIKMTAYV